MKKIILVFLGVIFILFSIKIVFFISDVEDNKLNSFTTDGCSMFPDGNWKECCVEHDKIYWKGGTRNEKTNSDENLKKCVGKKGHPFIGVLMKIGVSIGGTPYLPTDFRWGYGWEKFKNFN